MSASSRVFAGWDIGGTKSAAVIATAEGKILGKSTWPSNTQRGPEAMLADFLAGFAKLAEEFGKIDAVGVSVGGPLDSKRGIIFSPPNLPGWDNLPLREILEKRLQLPVMVEHDAAACLLAEHFWGSAVGNTHAAYITAGTGCGAGILIDGRILTGPTGQTPEIGHIRLTEKGPFTYGKAGCVESYCSGTGLAMLAQELFPEHFPNPVSVRQLAGGAADGDEKSREVLLVGARWMGRVCAMLSDLFSFQTIIVGSLARYLPPWWLEAVRAEYSCEVLPQNGAQTRIIAPALGDQLQDLSAIAPCVKQRAG